MKKFRVGIAGFGVVGQRRKDCIDRHPFLELVAISDQNCEYLNKQASSIMTFSSFDEMLDMNLDILFVCLPNNLAPIATISALEAGMHVFCEKPPGRSVQDIEAVIECELKHQSQKLMYGFNHRYHESVQDALKIVNDGMLGNVINLRGVYGKAKLVTFNQSDWRTRHEIAGGGVLLDQGIHMVDLMRLFAGEFVEVHSFISNKYWKYDVEDNAYAIMRTSDGKVAMLNSSATQWKHRFNLEITLERGSLTLGGILSGTKSYGSETLTVVTASPDTDGGDPRETITKYNHDISWDEEIVAFVQSIVEEKPIISGNSRDALSTMKLVSSIYKADTSWQTFKQN
jgi:predicted dehydrogenase